MRTAAVITFLLLFTIVACDKIDTSENPYVYDYSYFPIDSGNWREYEVLEINVDEPLGIFDTIQYFLLEQVAGIYIDAANDTLNELKRFYKDSLHHNWQTFNTWYVGIVGNEALQIEENIKYIKQKYPLKLGLNWNGNAYNHTDTLGQFSYKVVQIDIPEAINTINFDSVLKVSQWEHLDNLYKYSYFEKYAKGIGLIEKEAITIKSQEPPDISVPIEHRVKTGSIYKLKITNYGQAN